MKRALYTAAWVLPVTTAPIPRGAVLVDEDGCIAAVPQAQPVADPAATRVLSTRGADVVLTVVAGSVLYPAGRNYTLSPDALRSRIVELGERLREARRRHADA